MTKIFKSSCLDVVDEIEGQILCFFMDAPLCDLREHLFFLIIVFNYSSYYFIIIISSLLLYYYYIIYSWYLWYAMALVRVAIQGIAYQYVMLFEMPCLTIIQIQLKEYLILWKTLSSNGFGPLLSASRENALGCWATA